MMMKKHYDVVAAVVLHDHRVLCLQKGKTRYDYTTFRWEFPGGKIESNETPEDALRREMLEELKMDVRVGDHLVTVDHEYPDFSITLSAYLCTVVTPELELAEHRAYRWVKNSELMSLPWCAADIAIAQKVQIVCDNCDID